jgi:hypothetical protein
MSDKPAFVARKFQDAQKLAAKGYFCPLCSDTFQVDQKLWEHAKTQHGQQLGLADVADEEKARKQFRREATAKAYVDITFISSIAGHSSMVIGILPMNLVDGPSI